MKKIGALLFASILLTLTSAPFVHAQVDNGEFSNGDEGAPPNNDSEVVPGLGMGIPSYAGTGCPQGTVSAVLSPDQKSLSVLFDSYIAQAGGGTGVQRKQIGCQINIPFQVPPGYRVQVVKMDYRGFTSIPAQARSTFGAGFRYLSVNGQPTNARRVLRAKVHLGPKQENFQLTSILMAGQHWSPCGQSFVLASESLVNVMTNRQNQEVTTTVDSLDTVSTPVVYNLRWKRCQ